jgi:hypothetical protein
MTLRYTLADLYSAFQGLEPALNPAPPPAPPRKTLRLGNGSTDLESRVRGSGRKTARGAVEGTRHDAFRRIVAVCRSNGLSESTALDVARDARNYLVDATGFGEGEAEDLVRWAYRIKDADWETPAFEDRPPSAARVQSGRLRRWRRLMGVNS